MENLNHAVTVARLWSATPSDDSDGVNEETTMSRKATVTALSAALWIGTIGLAVAQMPAAPDNENGRFSFHRVDEGYLRLDTRTGQLSLCARKPTGWACHLLPDERNALEAEIARLQIDNGGLKKELLARGLPLPGGMKHNSPPLKLPEVEPKIPSDSDFDRMISFMERVWRRLTEKFGAIQRDYFGRT
jgi:hypothetical protein